MKIDSLVVVPTLLVILWAVLAAGTIATLGRMPLSPKPPVQKGVPAEQIVITAEPTPDAALLVAPPSVEVVLSPEAQFDRASPVERR
jgi:hypothetical protein